MGVATINTHRRSSSIGFHPVLLTNVVHVDSSASSHGTAIADAWIKTTSRVEPIANRARPVAAMFLAVADRASVAKTMDDPSQERTAVPDGVHRLRWRSQSRRRLRAEAMTSRDQRVGPCYVPPSRDNVAKAIGRIRSAGVGRHANRPVLQRPWA
jgi:hypothetical protein